MIQAYINKYFYFLFVFSLIFIILLYNLIGFDYIDEICAVVLFGLFFYTVIKTPDWKFNKVFLFTLFVFLFYTCYSIWIGSNVKKGILTDLIIQMKPYLGFFCVYQLRPQFDLKQKKLLKDILLVSWFAFLLPIGLISIVYYDIIYITMYHPTNFGIAVVVVSICYFFYSDFSWRNRITFLLLLSLGILSGRSKFYGFYVVAFFVIAFFSSIRHFKLNFKNLLLISCMLFAMFFVAWDKIAFYFYDAISGSSEVEEDMIARFVLYRTFPEILQDYFPFGSGLGSYATYASGLYYSNIYAEYGIDGIWGITKTYYNYIADAFYPSLAQFGVVGVILFLSFWIYILKKAFIYYKTHPNPSLQYFIVVILILCFLGIEGTTSSTFTSQGGFFVMMLLGMILANISHEQNIVIIENDSVLKNEDITN